VATSFISSKTRRVPGMKNYSTSPEARVCRIVRLSEARGV
jgi:hypothetical protein